MTSIDTSAPAEWTAVAEIPDHLKDGRAVTMFANRPVEAHWLLGDWIHGEWVGGRWVAADTLRTIEPTHFTAQEAGGDTCPAL